MRNGKDVLEDDDLSFLSNISGLEGALAKLKQARALAAEARAEIAAALGGAAAIKKSNKAKKKLAAKASKRTRKTPEVNFGVDLPDALTADEQGAINALKNAKGPLKKQDLIKATKQTWYTLNRALKALEKRKLVVASGATVSRAWEAK